MDRHVNAGQKKLKSIIDKAQGVLLPEVRLTKPKAIRTYTDETEVAGQIAELTKNSQDIFLVTSTRIYLLKISIKGQGCELIQNPMMAIVSVKNTAAVFVSSQKTKAVFKNR